MSVEKRGEVDGAPATPAPAELHRLLIQSVRDYAIFALDARGHVVSWNEGAERITGYTAKEIIGKHFSIFYPPEAVATGFPQHELEVAARVGRFEDEGWRVREDGSRYWSNVVITALRNGAGELVGYAKVTRDLTERRAAEEQARRLAAEEAARREAERRSDELAQLSEQLQQQAAELELQMEEAQALAEELEQTNEELQHALDEAQEAREAAERSATEAAMANRAKTEFLTVMSHELRTPLNAISGYAELLEMGLHGPVTEQQRSALARIQRSQRHLLSLINDILNFARLEAGQVSMSLAPVAVNEVLAGLEEMVTPQLRAKQLALETRYPRAPLVARADGEKVGQILLNLLSNAIKFTGAGGRIELGAAERDGRVEVWVSDTGVGIPPDKLDAIFEPFVQVDRQLSSSVGGTGLGLSISRDLARAMGGDVTVRSEPGRGSTFTLSLPRANGNE